MLQMQGVWCLLCSFNTSASSPTTALKKKNQKKPKYVGASNGAMVLQTFINSPVSLKLVLVFNLVKCLM